MEKKKNIAFIIKYVCVPLIAALIAASVPLIIYLSKEREREKRILQIRTELLQQQLQPNYLKKMERLIELAESGTVVIVFKTHKVYMNSNKEVVGEADENIDVSVPRIAYEKTLQDEWNKLATEIAEKEVMISSDVFRYFNDIANYVKKYPFPEQTNNYDYIMKSSWVDGNFQARWYSLNSLLKTKIENKLNLVE